MDRVKRLGYRVYVQLNKHEIDTGATENNPVTITLEDSLSVMYNCLDALNEPSKVCVTGQPGIGKPSGCMLYAIHALLFHRAAVLYLGYKPEENILFLQGEDWKYQAWNTSTYVYSKHPLHSISVC